MKIDSVNYGNFQVEEEVNDDGVAVTIIFSEDEVETLLSLYDPTYVSSPTAADCRPIVRMILDAIKDKGF
jgi:hypothetical protein